MDVAGLWPRVRGLKATNVPKQQQQQQQQNKNKKQLPPTHPAKFLPG